VSTPAAAAAGSVASWPPAAATDPQKIKRDKLPMQQRVLNALLNVSNVPYSSYVPTPETPLHRVDAAIKQVWLLALYVAVARSPPAVRVGLAAGVALLTVATQPPRLWRPQLLRLSVICAFIFLGAALGADGVPPLLQPRAPPPALDGLTAAAAAAAPSLLTPDTPYSYVLWNAGIFTVTRRSVNLALTAASLTFCALQGASLCLVTTPGEEMALALRRFLWPLRLVGVQTRRVALTLLLSLRFMSLVFEEVRNLCLGLAARGIAWREQGARGSIEIAAQMTGRLFANLFERSEKIAQAMAVRGFLGPEDHQTYCMRANRTSSVANAVALVLLGVLMWGAFLG
jgi:energy-coupling factor transporter transmembrane protein EcfT